MAYGEAPKQETPKYRKANFPRITVDLSPDDLEMIDNLARHTGEHRTTLIKRLVREEWENVRRRDTVREYAIINRSIENAPGDSKEVLFISQDPQEIVDKLLDCNCTDADSAVEMYLVDKYDDFFEGSDFFTVSDFIRKVRK